MIKTLTVSEVRELTKKLESDISQPPGHARRGAYPRRPRPSLSGGAEAVPGSDTQKLISAIARSPKAK